MAAFDNYSGLVHEVPYENSRLDFRLAGGNRSCYVEVKSVTLVQERTALFPDAPTLRGTKHLNHLMALKKAGHEAAIVFWVQREDAVKIRPHHISDPVFADTLKACAQQGVRVLAYKSRVTVEGIEFIGEIPVKL